jgi:PAS domain S-box-containing protein
MDDPCAVAARTVRTCETQVVSGLAAPPLAGAGAGRRQEPELTPSRLHRLWPALLLLAVGLLATAVATRQTRVDITASARREFSFACHEIGVKVNQRLQEHEQILRSGAALCVAAPALTRAQWHTFVQNLQVERQFPGIQGVGFSVLIAPAHLAGHVAEIRQQGFPNYRMWPEGERAVYSAIIFLEPFTNRNLRAFGYDMFSEPIRRVAMERARDQNAAALSAKVTLVQETATDVQAGTLMYVPVYDPKLPLDTVAQRRAALQGWVYSPYRMTDLMRGILGEWDSAAAQRIRLQIFDGEEPLAESLLSDTHPVGAGLADPAVRFTVQTPVTYAGRRWTLRFTQGLPQFGAAQYFPVWIVAGSGTALSLLLAGLLYSLSNTRFNARRLAQRLTADLQHTTERLALATAAGGVGIWDYEVLTNTLIWDDQMFRLYGITHTQFSGAYAAWMAGVHPDDRQRGDAEIQKALRGEREFDTEFRVLWPDGSVRHIQAQARVQRDAAGQPVRMLGTNWDITGRKRAEAAVRERAKRTSICCSIPPPRPFTASTWPATAPSATTPACNCWATSGPSNCWARTCIGRFTASTPTAPAFPWRTAGSSRPLSRTDPRTWTTKCCGGPTARPFRPSIGRIPNAATGWWLGRW